MKRKIKSKSEPTLEENEEIIEHGLEAYREAGLALKRIRDGDQYQAAHKTFEAYLLKRWGMSRAQGKRLIAAAETAETVAPIGSHNPPPATERVAREIKGTPEQKRVIWNKTVKKHGNKPTAKQTRNVAEEENVVDIKTKRQQRKRNSQPERPSITHDAKVIEWVWGKMDDGWNRDEIVASSKAGRDGWPLKGEALSNGAVTECKAIIVHLKRLNARPVASDARPKPAGPLKKVRKEATGTYGHLLDTQIWMREMTNKISRYNVERLDIDGKDATTVETLKDYFDDLIEHGVWIERTTRSIQARMSDAKQREKIHNLRHGNAGRPASEIPARLAKADELERNLENKLASGEDDAA